MMKQYLYLAAREQLPVFVIAFAVYAEIDCRAAL